MLGYVANFNQIHAYAWVPLVFVGLEVIREGGRRRGAVIVALASAFTWLAGHPQIAVYAIYVAAVFVALAMAVDRPGLRMALARVGWSIVGLGLGLAVAAVAVVPMLEFGAASGRFESNWQLFIGSSYPVRELLTLLAPFAFGGFRAPQGAVPYVGETGDSAYVGILTFALAMVAPIVSSQHRSNARIWMAVAILETLLALGPATPLATLYFHLPGTARFQAPLRHLFLASLGLSVCASLAFTYLVANGRRAVIAAALGATAVLAGAASALVAWSGPDVRAAWATNEGHVAWALGWPGAVAVALGVAISVGTLFRRWPAAAHYLGVVLVAVTALDLAGFHYRWPGYRFRYADVERASVVPRPRIEALRQEILKNGQRLLPVDGSRNPFARPNLTRPWNLPSATGTGSLNIARYATAVGADSAGIISAETLSDDHVALDLFAVRYALVPNDSKEVSRLSRPDGRWEVVEELVYEEDNPEDHYVLLRNRRARPRAWCVPHVVETEADEALRALRTGQLRDGRPFDPDTTALVEPGTMSWRSTTAASPTASPIPARVRPNEYRVESRTPCVLIVSEVHYPWWRAAIDGADAPVLRVNYTMVGIALPPGRHIVTLWLRPWSVWIGGAGTVLGGLACVWLSRPRQQDLGRSTPRETGL
jgi:hypothetical protein